MKTERHKKAFEPEIQSEVQEEKELPDEESEPSEEELELSAPVELEVKELASSSWHDPIRQYIQEIKQYPLLDAQDEFHLVMQLRVHGDLSAAKTLISANLRLVVKIAFEYRTFYSNLFDLIQEGNIGLMKAVSKFDPSKGARLSYYASWWIRSYILKYLLDNFRLVKVGTTQAQKKLFYHLMREKDRLEAQGFFAGPKLLAEKLNVREKDIIEMEQRLSGYGSEMSLDAPVEKNTDNRATHQDLLADQRESVDDVLVRDELLKILQDELPAFEKLLNSKELYLLKERLLVEHPKTLQEIANLYGLTRERVRQIETKVIEKLKDFLSQKMTLP